MKMDLERHVDVEADAGPGAVSPLPPAVDTATPAPVALEPEVHRAIPSIVASVEARYPAASPGLVRRCVDDAVEAFRDARIRLYLPILIERRAAHAVDRALGRSA